MFIALRLAILVVGIRGSNLNPLPPLIYLIAHIEFQLKKSFCIYSDDTEGGFVKTQDEFYKKIASLSAEAIKYCFRNVWDPYSYDTI